jgi:hypothetical protein
MRLMRRLIVVAKVIALMTSASTVPQKMLINSRLCEVQEICVAKICRPLLPQICTAKIAA